MDLARESLYPITFRSEDAQSLGQYLKKRESVVLVGAKRVGINNFLRFFLYHKNIISRYIADYKNHFFIPVDLNDLVEREMYPFWTLTLKRISDSVSKLNTKASIKKEIETLFVDCIQTQDLFYTIDSVRKALVILSENNFLPTIFFIRFDRIFDIISPEFFANLQGLRDATQRRLAYVFTSFRSLDYLSPNIFDKTSLSVFSKDLYLKPANSKDARIICNTYKDRYNLTLSEKLENDLLELVDGYNQYLQLALINLSERSFQNLKNKEDLFHRLLKDERIVLQSEELWESLSEQEKKAVLKILNKEKISSDEKEDANYVWLSGFVKENNSFFSSIFVDYLTKVKEEGTDSKIEFTKKENALFNLLKEVENEICEREKIVESVWPEVEEFGVTDWAIDRLVSRVRGKLKIQKSKFEIQTIKTRGYKLVPS